MYQILEGDVTEQLKTLENASVDAIVTDPPYGLEFMGKDWDAPWKTDHRQGFYGTMQISDSPFGRSKVRTGNGASYGADAHIMQALQDWHFHWASEALRVLKPGGYLLAFGGSRTYHRLACAVEDAGFEIRDQIMWIYGCLDEQTELVAESGVKPYHKARIGERILCYDLENGKYSYQPILEIVEYDYCDTAYRLIGDFGEQVVSRNHRCIVEQNGKEVFQVAETLGTEARVPILEGLPELQQALSDLQSNTSGAKEIMQPEVFQGADWESEQQSDATRAKERGGNYLRGLPSQEVGSVCMVEESKEANMQPQVQWRSQGRGVEETCARGTDALDVGVGVGDEGTDDRREQSGVEGRANLPETQGRLCGSVNQVRPLSAGIPEHGAERRLCYGTSTGGGKGDRTAIVASGSGSSSEPSCGGQRTDKSDAVCHQCGSQGVRAWRGHQTVVVRVLPFHYVGKVWCLHVPTGAFVAVRNGVAFPTGNSGFPKSLDVSKAIDKTAGAERVIVGSKKDLPGYSLKPDKGRGVYSPDGRSSEIECAITAPATDAAKQWAGWGTALKPAHEPIVVARKPLIGTVAANVLKYGTGALNIDACRVGEFVNTTPSGVDRRNQTLANMGYRPNAYQVGQSELSGAIGRWPANVIHDGSEEVLAVFPDAPGALGVVTGEEPSSPTQDIYGNFKKRATSNPRDGEPSAQRRYATKGATNFAALPGERRIDSGSAARFFYCAKSSRQERNTGCENLGKKPLLWSLGTQSPGTFQAKGTDHSAQNFHPTVKPIALMAYLCRLVTPPQGTVLDLFMGSGSTGIAALREKFNFIGIEVNPEYVEIARRRIEADAPLFNKEG
jgi:DNA modification methylase